jgi:hypothetical protein
VSSREVNVAAVREKAEDKRTPVSLTPYGIATNRG